MLGGVIAYHNDVKRDLLGVSDASLAAHGAVSEEVVREMAAGARRVIGARVGLAITGVAGPSGGTPEKPVGTVWIAVDIDGDVTTRLHRLWGDRDEIRDRAAQWTLDLLRRRCFRRHTAPDRRIARRVDRALGERQEPGAAIPRQSNSSRLTLAAVPICAQRAAGAPAAVPAAMQGMPVAPRSLYQRTFRTMKQPKKPEAGSSPSDAAAGKLTVTHGEPSPADEIADLPADEPVESEPDAADSDDTDASICRRGGDVQHELSAERDKYLRLAAEYDNYRKRTTRERGELTSRAQADLTKHLHRRARRSGTLRARRPRDGRSR